MRYAKWPHKATRLAIHELRFIALCLVISVINDLALRIPNKIYNFLVLLLLVYAVRLIWHFWRSTQDHNDEN